MTETEHKSRIRAIVSGPGRTSRWISAHLDYCEPDWCLIYPFKWEQDHYPKYRSQPKTPNYPVHRMMCEYRHGPPPTHLHHSAHSCNRGTEGCVNPMHVSWKTPSDNQRDRHNGMPERRERLTPEQVDEIRALQGRARPADIAKQFGVTLRNVRLILDGKTWRDTNSRRLFTEDEVIEIRALVPLIKRGTAITTEKIASRYRATYGQIRRIIDGKSYAWVGHADVSHG